MATNNKKKYKIVRSNYTIKAVHKRLDGDKTIYERDYSVLNDVGTWKPGEINAVGSPTFKMVHNDESRNVRKHGYGNWVTPTCENKSGTTAWDMECISTLDTNNSENEIKIKPNYTSLLNFAYFGSCVDLIRTSFNNLINNFPAELYIGDEPEEINPMDINIYSNGTNATQNDDLKMFALSYGCYEAFDLSGNSKGDVTQCTIKVVNSGSCLSVGTEVALCDITMESGATASIKTISDGKGGYVYSVTKGGGVRIRPKKEYIKKKLSELSEFEQYVVNRDSNPIYTMFLDYLYETDEGVRTYLKKYTLPSIHGWNPDLQGTSFQTYYDDLLTLATFYDERQTGNLWRAMTHESIKNMDLTYQNGNSNDDSYDYAIGSTKMQNVINAFGRQLDSVKLYADTMKYLNNITYGSNSSAPDYTLSDKLENCGWEVTSVAPSLDNTIVATINGKTYTSSDVNIQFMKNLILNSKQILAHKGTRHGIEMLLSLFGLKSKTFVKENYDYEINEYVYKTDSFKDGLDEDGNKIERTLGVAENELEKNGGKFNVEKYNTWKKTYEWEPDESSVDEDTLQGLPLNIVEYSNKGEATTVADDATTEGDTTATTKKYIVPWFDKNISIDGDPYFEMGGGWMKIPFKKVNNPITNEIVTISADTATTIYNKSINNINVAKKIGDLLNFNKNEVYNDMIFYISDISDIDSYLNNKTDEQDGSTGDDGNGDEYTNYFILKNVDYYFSIGPFENNNEQIGWRNVPKSEFNGSLTDDAKKIMLIESMVDSSIGNKPHSGTLYDDGEEYISYFKQIFKESIKNDNFKDIAYDCETNNLNSGITLCGFNLSAVTDNTKVHYFTDYGILLPNANGTDTSDENKENNDYQPVLTTPWGDGDTTHKSHDFEKGTGTTRESAAYTVINTKRMDISFNNNVEYDYIINNIMPFLEQMIPSTTLLTIKYSINDDVTGEQGDSTGGDGNGGSDSK